MAELSTLPEYMLRNAREMGDQPAMREKYLGIWKTYKISLRQPILYILVSPVRDSTLGVGGGLTVVQCHRKSNEINGL